jgi:iron complex outermembrane receptor protein
MTTFRTGYVHKSGQMVFKLLYGEGFQEPSPRVLYGAWEGLGSDPDLKPEKSRTIEFSSTYMNHITSHLLSVYYVKNSDTILNLQEGARNVGERQVFGLDYHFKWDIQSRLFNKLYFWGYYSYIHTRGDEIYVPETDSYQKDSIGDIAPHKIYVGATGNINTHLTTTLLARYISRRQTVATNPIPNVAPYTLVDLNILLKNVFVDGLNLSFKINNLFNKSYFHPGIRTANSGNQPGFFDENGTWNGSDGWLNSLLPQMKRTFLLSLYLEI